MRTVIAALIGLTILAGAADGAAPKQTSDRDFNPKAGDVVAFIGGESVVQQGETGHLESLLAATRDGPGVRFRNLAWEGDTVFEQPRDLNFPGVVEQLKRVKATIVFIEFGRAEALDRTRGIKDFVDAYEKLCDAVEKVTPGIVIVTPAPFEKPTRANLPDLTVRNDVLTDYGVEAYRLGRRRGYWCAHPLYQFLETRQKRYTADDGRRLTPYGTAISAKMIAMQLGSAVAALEPDPAPDGKWATPKLETLRQAVVEKNRLWFDYWRPMNWAFLGGDRTFTQSSRDPNDLNVRIFPRELEKFMPLIEKAEARIDELAKDAGGGK